MKRITYIFFLLLAVALPSVGADADSIPSGFGSPLSWRIGVQVNPAWVPGTNKFIKGDNYEYRIVNAGISADFRADFSFSPGSKQGMLYPHLYQGIGVGVNSFFANSLLGSPVSAYVYQGAPFATLSHRLRIGYEWRFGAAFGWKHYGEENVDNNAPVSTSVTAMLGLGVKLEYDLSRKWQLSLGLNATHYSNGNTSWPNRGVNALGAAIGVAYTLAPEQKHVDVPDWLEQEADQGRWMYDIMAYGAWRKRALIVGDEPRVCPGRFGILGLQLSPLRKLNRYVAVGPAVDLQWDESAGLAPYWVEGTTGDDIKFERPPFGKQLSVGVSAHAELTMPIFAVNAGLGYDFITPKGEKRFYQSLALKTFFTRSVFLNVGYRLGNFKDPQNLMLGLGIRL